MSTFNLPEDTQAPWDRPPRQLPRINAKLVLALLGVLIAAGVYLGASSYVGRNRTVHLVNGAPMKYDIEINGQRVTLWPYSTIKHKVPEGNITITRFDPSGAAESAELTIKTPFFSRLFSDDTFVINPDRNAVILWERQGYYENVPANDEDPEYRYKVFFGSMLTHHRDVHFPFEPWPEEIRLDNRQQVTTRDGLMLYVPESPSDCFDMIAWEVGDDQAIAYLKRLLVFAPNDEECLTLLGRELPPAETLALLRPYCASRPLLLHAHLASQDARRLLDESGDELEAEYLRILQEAPEDAAHQYLHARVIDDPAEQLEQYKDVAQRADAPVRAKHGLVMYYLSQGMFEQAIDRARTLRALEPRDEHYIYHEMEALLGAGRFGECADMIRKAYGRDMENGALVEWEMYAMARDGKAGELANRREAFITHLSTIRRDSALIGSWSCYLSAIERYLTNAPAKEVAELFSACEDYTSLVIAWTLNGDVDAYYENVIELGSYEELLLGAVLAAHHAHPSLDEWLARIAEELPHDKDTKAIATWLAAGRSSGESLDPKLVEDLWSHRQTKMLLHVLIGQLDRKHRDRHYAFARTLNIDPGHPSRLIRDIVGK